MFGLATDWPIEWDELERYYVEAERRLNVAGRPQSVPRGSAVSAVSAGGGSAVVQPADPEALGRTERVQVFAAADGAQSHDLGRPRRVRALRHVRRCVPDRRPLLARLHLSAADRAKKITLHDRMLVRKLIPHDTNSTIVAAHGVHQDRPNEVTEYRARLFVLAGGQCWSPHLLLLSMSSRFPNGLANRSGLVGRYMNGHKFISAMAEIDEETFPGQNMTHSLISREYFRCAPNQPFVRHDTRVWESSSRQRAAAAKRGGSPAAWRRRARRLAIACAQGQRRSAAHLLRLASFGRQPADARSDGEESLRRSDAEDRAPARRGRGGSRSRDVGALHERVRAPRARQQRPADHQAVGLRLLGSPGRRLSHGHRSLVQRVRHFWSHARSREPVRDWCADAADRRLHEWHAHVCRAVAEIGESRLRNRQPRDRSASHRETPVASACSFPVAGRTFRRSSKPLPTAGSTRRSPSSSRTAPTRIGLGARAGGRDRRLA